MRATEVIASSRHLGHQHKEHYLDLALVSKVIIDLSQGFSQLDAGKV